MTLSLRVRAPAKVNLFLHVGERRLDGYHSLQSLVAFTEACDVVHLSFAEELNLETSGRFAQGLPTHNNLVLRAAQALASERGVEIVLEKNLPVAAGLGGGSADAAAALRGLNTLWELKRDNAELLNLAATLGSDVPACVYSRTAWMEGRGERLTILPPLPPLDIVLVNPGVTVPTRDVFQALNMRSGIDMMTPPRSEIRDVWDLVSYLADAGNDLEAPATVMFPTIDQVLASLEHEPGCVHAQMSGSGATCFGLFQEGPWAQGAAERLQLDHPLWWVTKTRFAGPEFAIPEIVI